MLVAIRCPLCDSDQCRIEHFSYTDRETGYLEEGDKGLCLVCGCQSYVEDFEVNTMTNEERARKYLVRRDSRFDNENYMPECFNELFELLNQVEKESRHKALNDLASAVKKVCPEIIGQLVEAANPADAFISFLQGLR